jgi:hypothetical protein
LNVASGVFHGVGRRSRLVDAARIRPSHKPRPQNTVGKPPATALRARPGHAGPARQSFRPGGPELQRDSARPHEPRTVTVSEPHRGDSDTGPRRYRCRFVLPTAAAAAVPIPHLGLGHSACGRPAAGARGERRARTTPGPASAAPDRGPRPAHVRPAIAAMEPDSDRAAGGAGPIPPRADAIRSRTAGRAPAGPQPDDHVPPEPPRSRDS